MEENIHKIFKQSGGGFEVWPTKRARLPGFFTNVLQAERAYEKYEAECNVAKINKRASKK